jgi:ammonia channel protein AmtB
VSANERGYFQPYDHAQLLFGTFVLWIGWYAFNSVSVLGARLRLRLRLLLLLAR